MQAFGNNHIAAYYIPSKPRFVDSGAVRQNIHEREDGYPDSHVSCGSAAASSRALLNSGKNRAPLGRVQIT